MKKQLLFAALAAALLAGCSKEAEAPNVEAPATHISAKAVGAKSPETKAPLEGTSFNGKQAQVFTTILPLDAFSGDKTRMFTNAYARGTMTFADNSYSQYDPAGLSGVKMLPSDKSAVYLYGFYPADWITENMVSYESLTRSFDGKTDLMATWLTAADQQKVAYLGGASGTTDDKADFMFRHLLTCYNIRVVGADAGQAAAWGRIKSVKLKDATQNKVCTGENLGYTYSAGGGAVSFYKLGGTISVPTYSDVLFEKTAFADMFIPTTTVQPACYSMAAPVTVDNNSATAELTLVVTTVNKSGGTEMTVEIPISLDQTKFASNSNSTRGYTVSVTLSFTAEAITPTASVGEWAVGDTYEQEVDPNPNPKVEVGDVINGGIVFWVSDDKAHYKIVYAQPIDNNGLWSGKTTYAVGCTDENDGRVNVAMMEAYSRDHVSDANAETKTTGVFATDFPMASWCKALSTAETPAGQWYMPARNEILEIANQKLLLVSNGFVVGSKWSMTSSEMVGNLSYIYLWQTNQATPIGSHTKTLRDNTRCIAYY